MRGKACKLAAFQVCASPLGTRHGEPTGNELSRKLPSRRSIRSRPPRSSEAGVSTFGLISLGVRDRAEGCTRAPLPTARVGVYARRRSGTGRGGVAGIAELLSASRPHSQASTADSRKHERLPEPVEVHGQTRGLLIDLEEVEQDADRKLGRSGLAVAKLEPGA